jgi:hypothetical protein
MVRNTVGRALSIEQPKTYFADLTGVGSWSSPSGRVKLFTAEEFEVKWQKSKKLAIVRDTSDTYILPGNI